MDNDKLISFLDAAQRTIIGENVTSEANGILKVKNPVVVDIIPQVFPEGHPQAGQASGQMSLRLLPLFFREFLAVKTEPVYFEYIKNNITMLSKFENGWDFRLYHQYSSMFDSDGATQAIPPQDENKVIKLFDDDEEVKSEVKKEG